MVSASAVTVSDRRKHARASLKVSVKIHGEDPDGSAWQDAGTSRDASAGGAAVALEHAVRPGQVLYMSLPLPKRFRTAGLLDESYRVYAVVRSVRPTGEVGVLFLEGHPKGYLPNDAGLFLHPAGATGSPDDRRHARRVEGPFFFALKPAAAAETLDPIEEAAVAENLSRGGARVKSSLQLRRGDIVYVRELGGLFRTRAEIRNVYIGPDRVQRANLMFLDDQAPPRLLARD